MHIPKAYPCVPCAVEFRNSLEAKLGIELPSTLVFDYPSIAAIAGHVATLLPHAGLSSDDGAATASDADFFAVLLGASGDVSYPGALAAGGASGSGSIAVGVAAVATRQPAGIMAAGDPTRQDSYLHSLVRLLHA
jgi:hypothetical protein